MTYHLDLRVRVLPKAHQVFLARPGAEYGLYSDFVEAFAIGPEFPGLVLTEGLAISKQSGLDNKLKMSRAIVDWANAGKPDDKIPSASPSDHSSRGKSRGWPQYISALKAYFDVANKGDLILIPPGQYSQDAVLAEFTDDSSRIAYVKTTRYRDFLLPARPFRILAKLKKKDLPVDLLDLIAKPNMFVALGESHKRVLYRHAYGTFVYEGDYSCRLDVRAADYNTIDDVVLLGFINFVANNTRIVTFGEGGSILPLTEAAFVDLGEYALALRTNVNSPGNLTLQASFLTPIVVVAMLALASDVGPVAAGAAAVGKITIGNSLAPAGDPCTAAVSEAVLTQLELDGLTDEWPKACELARKAIKATNLQVSPRVTVSEDDGN